MLREIRSPNAYSRDLFGNNLTWFIRTFEVGTDPFGKLFGKQQVIGFGHSPFAMDPFGFSQGLCLGRKRRTQSCLDLVLFIFGEWSDKTRCSHSCSSVLEGGCTGSLVPLRERLDKTSSIFAQRPS